MNFLSAFVDIKVDDSKLKTQLAKARSAVTKTVDKIKASFRKMGATFKAVFSKMVKYAKWGSLAIAGAFALVTRNAMKQEDAINRLNITLKATGHAAGFSSKQLLEQAASLQKVTRFGDETVIAMQTMLLTFKNIKGDEFKRATEAALDMATAEASVSGRAVDLTAVSIRLGKALNDPILGLTALARVGVDFTETQKSMIREMVMVGDIAGAQAIILRELESEFGGMSRDVDTASGALKQMWNVLGDVTEKIGAAFIPGIKDSARAIKEWAEKNEEKIGRWAETFVAYLTYAKNVLWIFVKFLQSDWQAGIKVALQITLELFKGFGKSLVILMKDVASRAWRAFVKEFGEGLGKWLIEASKPTGILGKVFSITPIGMAKRAAMMKTGVGLVKGAGATAAPAEGPTTAEKLRKVREETAAEIKAIVPPELEEAFEAPLARLKEGLEEVVIAAEEIQEPMEKALVEPFKKMTPAMEEALGKMRQWASDASDIWNNLADVATRAFDSTADTLTDLVMTGKADFKALAESILRDITRMIIKAMMARAVGVFMGGGGSAAGAGAVASLQGGGVVKKTGLAVVHKGERFSGADEGELKQRGGTVNINVNAIDAAGTAQFLLKNKKSIATVLQGTLTSNHPLRRSIR